MFVRILCLSFMLTVVNAAAAIMRLPPIPEILAHKEGCYIKEINDVIPFNKTISLLGMCQARKCTKEYIHMLTCGVHALPGPECFLTENDYSRPYSDCCPSVICDLEENIIAD